MTSVLHIEASPRRGASHSAELARELIDVYVGRYPQSVVETVDVWNTDLPPFDATMIEAKFAVLKGRDPTPEQKVRWAQALSLSQNFNRADAYVISLPMWNYGIPYRLKHYIDVVTLPGQNWSWSKAEGYRPLLSGKKAALIYSGAADYPDGISADGYADFQKPYMRQWLRFIGVKVVGEVVVAPTLTDPDDLARIKETGRRKARSIAMEI